MGFIFQTDNAYDWAYSNNTNQPFDLFICVESHPYANGNGCALSIGTSDGRYNHIIPGGRMVDVDEVLIPDEKNGEMVRHLFYHGHKRVFLLTLMPGVRLSVLQRWDGVRTSFSLSVFKLEV